MDSSSDPGLSRPDRAERILDAAGRLVLRHGFHRVTVDDIAGEAGVGKGTVYLHWKSKTDVLYALLCRELAAVVRELMEFTAERPENIRLHRYMPKLLLMCYTRPLVRALFTGDREVLGSRIRQGDGPEWMELITLGRGLSFMGEAGLIGDEVTPEMQRHGLCALFLGMLAMDGVEPDALGKTQKAQTLSWILFHTFEKVPPASMPPALAPAVEGELRELLAACEAGICGCAAGTSGNR